MLGKATRTEALAQNAQVANENISTNLSSEIPPAEKVASIFEKEGIKSKIFNFEKDSEFPEAIIFEQRHDPNIKTIRLYRGVNQIDESLLNQASYAMRKRDNEGKMEIVNNVENEVKNLADNPSYENLINYYEKIFPQLSQRDKKLYEYDIENLEENILNRSITVRKSLLGIQISRAGGVADSSISPYIAASTYPYEALSYGKEALMIIDIPISEIQKYDLSSETSIKGILDKKYISGIIFRNEKPYLLQDYARTKVQLGSALRTINSDLPPELDEKELKKLLDEKNKSETEIDQAQLEKDLEQVRLKRTTQLKELFPEVTETQEKGEENKDIYTKTKQEIFDYYNNRMKKIGRNGKDIEDYDYSEKNSSSKKSYNRENITDSMLIELRKLVLRLEQYESNRQR